MNIITNKPVIFSNAEGANPDTIKAAADVLTGIGTTLAGRQRQLTEVEQRCGKKPLGKKQRAQWQKCVDANGGLAIQPTTPPTQEQLLPDTNTKQPMSKNMKIGLIVSGVVVAGIIAFLIYKSSKE